MGLSLQACLATMKRQKSLTDYCHGSSGTAAQKRSREDRSTSSGASIDDSSSTLPTSDSEQSEDIHDCDSEDDLTVSFIIFWQTYC